MDVAMFHSWWTVLLVAIFVGIVVWAFSAKRQPRFDAAARMPLEDDAPGGATGDKHHG